MIRNYGKARTVLAPEPPSPSQAHDSQLVLPRIENTSDVLCSTMRNAVTEIKEMAIRLEQSFECRTYHDIADHS